MDVQHLLRQLANNRLTPDEMRQLQSLSEKDMFPGSLPEKAAAPDKTATLHAYEKVARQLEHRVPSAIYRPILMAAAMISVVVLVACFLFVTDTPVKPVARQVSTAPGQHMDLQLPDGSHIAVNGNSRLSYSGRHVKLEAGEIFLDVQPDAAHPFTVQSGHLHVKVLGTSFSVRNRRKQVTVAVKTGRVAANGRELSPGSQLSGDIISPANPQQIGSWTKNELVFEDASLEEILQEINDTYGYRYSTAHKQLLQKRYRAAFRQRSVEDMIRTLADMGHFTYTLKDSLITIP